MQPVVVQVEIYIRPTKSLEEKGDVRGVAADSAGAGQDWHRVKGWHGRAGAVPSAMAPALKCS